MSIKTPMDVRAVRSPAAVARFQLEMSAVEMSISGKSMTQIASALDLKSAKAAGALVRAGLARNAPSVEDLESARQLQLQRADYMISKLTERIEQGDMDAVDKAHKWVMLQVKLQNLEPASRVQQSLTVDAHIEATTSTTIAVVAATQEYQRLMDQLVSQEIDARRTDIEQGAIKKALAQEREQRALESGAIVDVVDVEVVEEGAAADVPIEQGTVEQSTSDDATTEDDTLPNNVVMLHSVVDDLSL